ncbi:hypothetical protein BKA65DRAFT_241999 [Rhexocercosporidium sp. MPI-PUGE-AT-0058]|nr:hypothetical protein BKA65DRAFT_241999 [Rhexocercosporidium sp. MPI-PUGE-AT-0058]
MIADAAFVPPLSETIVDEDNDFRPDGVLHDHRISRLLEIYDGRRRGADGLWQRDLRLLSEYVLVLRRRRVFVTLDRKLGLGMESMRLGDDITLIHGSSAPLILRQKTAGDGTKLYELVGQCYVEGAMYGEACTWDEFNADERALRRW